jgi:hypothetical protein
MVPLSKHQPIDESFPATAALALRNRTFAVLLGVGLVASSLMILEGFFYVIATNETSTSWPAAAG